MKKILLFLLAVSVFGISEITAQTATIDSNHRVNVTQLAADGVYTIDISNANFAGEQKAKEVFNFFAEHPALHFYVNYAEGEVIMKVVNIAVSNGAVDLNYLNGVLKRRSMAYQRLF